MVARVAGVCAVCGERADRGAMLRHLAACVARRDGAGGGAPAEWIHVRIDGGGPFWLDVEARADARLNDLDGFLRRIWLECCGHLSAFYVTGGRGATAKSTRVRDVLGSVGAVVRYEYDFGSTTALGLRGMGGRSGRGEKGVKVRLLARNEAPPFVCDECGQPAMRICPFGDGDNPFVCEVHSPEHGCEDPDCHVPVVNSPRVGVCGYTG